MFNHEDFACNFTLHGLELKAVGFLKPDEEFCPGEEMLRRATSDTWQPVEAAEGKIILDHAQELPFDLCDKRLVLGWLNETTRTLVCFGWEAGRWYYFGDYIRLGFNDTYVVLCSRRQ